MHDWLSWQNLDLDLYLFSPHIGYFVPIIYIPFSYKIHEATMTNQLRHILQSVFNALSHVVMQSSCSVIGFLLCSWLFGIWKQLTNSPHLAVHFEHIQPVHISASQYGIWIKSKFGAVTPSKRTTTFESSCCQTHFNNINLLFSRQHGVGRIPSSVFVNL